MKVLFAVSSESISDAIVKKYQREYKEILSYKNVYYFNAILKEIQKDKTYDRIVISEDLEPLSNNYDAIDKFIFEKLDNISDEAQDIDGNETSIILICTDRQTKGNSFLVKLFSIGIYNALLGAEKSIDNVCKLINKPRVKKEAKIYYKIDSDDANYNNKDDNEVSELEIQNILTHFKKLGKNTDKFAESFNSISTQYTDEQLKIIINCLPMNVKAVLEEDSPKYQELMSINGMVQKVNSENRKLRDAQDKTGIKIDIIENKEKQKMSGPIVIPASVRTSKNKSPMPVRPVGNDLEIKTPNTQQASQKVVKKTIEPQSRPAQVQKVAEQSTTTQVRKQPVQQRPAQVQAGRVANTQDGMLRKKAPVPTQKMNELEKNKVATAEKADTLRKRPVQATNNLQKKVRPVEVPKNKPPVQENLNNSEEDDELNLNMMEGFEDDDLILPEKNVSLDELDELPGLDELPSLEDDFDSDELPGIEDNVDENSDLSELDDFDSNDELPGLEDDLEEDNLPGLDELPNLEDDLDTNELPGIDDIESNLSGEDDELPGLDNNLGEDDELPVMDDLPNLEDDFGTDELPETDDSGDLPAFDDDELPDLDNDFSEEVDLPGIDELDDLDGFNDTIQADDTSDDILSGVDDLTDDLSSGMNSNVQDESQEIESIKPKVDYSMSSLNSLLTKDKKIVTFLGTTKNGTSFLVNNLAALFSSLGINTAILDMTQNRNSYYIYTNNEEELRNIAYNSISKLQKGFAEGIKVDKNLSVYTALPNDGKDYSNAEPILSTLVQNHSLILIDCDFETDPSYFASCQEIYLVQSMDILTIQPLTAFLRELKAKGVLESEKVRVVINKELKVKSLTTKAIIGGMSFYNDPSMSFMTELFNKDMVKACSIPFDANVYSKYLDSMATCKLSLSGYSKQFNSQLQNLGNMVYPLVGKGNYGGKMSSGSDYGSKKGFSSAMNNTLNQMKNKY